MSDFVDPNDLTVTRDEDGEILPQVTTAGNLGKVKAIPMAYGTVQEHFGDGVTSDIETEMIAKLFRDQYVEPDLNEAAKSEGFEECNAEYIESMYALVPRDLLMALLELSGVNAEVEMQDGNAATVNVGGN